MKKQAIIALDIGATSIKGAAFDRRGAFTARGSRHTEGKAGPGRVLDNAAALVESLSKGLSPLALGISSCGMIDPRTSTVIDSTSMMPGWPDTNIAAEMKKRTGLDCAARNDGDCAALGEAVFGAGRGTKVFAMFTLGTGVGGGITVSGKLFDGENCAAGRLGHIKPFPGGRKCACGARGCLEAYASAYACRAALGMEPLEAFRLAAAGNARAKEFVEKAACALGLVFADLANIINPGVIAVGGGMAGGWHSLRPGIMKAFNRCALAQSRADIKIVQAITGNNAGLLGAFTLIHRLPDSRLVT